VKSMENFLRGLGANRWGVERMSLSSLRSILIDYNMG
jgi:hypothetical protein